MIEVVAKPIITGFNPAIASIKQTNSKMSTLGRPEIT